MKKCSKCKIEQEVESFYKDVTKSDGLRPDCKTCIINYNYSRKQTDEKFRHRRKEISRKSAKKMYLINRDKRRKYENELRRMKYHTDENYRIKAIKLASAGKTKRLRENPHLRAIESTKNRVSLFLKRKTDSFSNMLGCKRDEFKNHLESQFRPGMSWENYGKWHIDHKYPISVAYKEGSESFKKACHYTNLQPLWAKDNIKKSNKI